MTVLLKGKTEANRIVEIKAEVGGQVESLPAEKGAVVERGQTICKLAVEDRELRVAEAQAAVEKAQIEYDGALRLKTGGYQSETAIATAKANLESAKANLLRRQIDLQKTAIRAPFDGVIDDQPAEIGALMRAGDTCATILDLDPLVVSARVSEQEIANVPVEGQVNARLVTGEQMSGKIRYVSRQSDEVTRTFRIEAAIDNNNMAMAAGITTEVSILTREVPAHLISAALLILDDQGELGVRVLDEKNVVQFYRVQLLGDAAEGVWVAGLPETTTLITVGHEYVGVGEKVEVAMQNRVDKNAPQVSGSAQ